MIKKRKLLLLVFFILHQSKSRISYYYQKCKNRDFYVKVKSPQVKENSNKNENKDTMRLSPDRVCGKGGKGMRSLNKLKQKLSREKNKEGKERCIGTVIRLWERNGRKTF